MKNYPILLSTLVLTLFYISCDTKKPSSIQNVTATIETPYKGLKTPDKVAELFPANFHSSRDRELKGSFSPDMKEFSFTTSHYSPFLPSVIVFKKEENKYNSWKKYDFHTMDSGHDNILYAKTKYIERTDTGWSKIKSLGSMIEKDNWGIMRLTASAKGTYVFDDYKNNDVIRISTIKNGKREEPKLLGKNINTGKWTAHPFIAADESFLMWDSEREEGYGGSDIYISFKQKNGSWGTAINLGNKVNTAIDENTARLTKDKKYLCFWRAIEKQKEDGTTYWISSKHWVDFIQLKKELMRLDNSNQ
ncbi:hypothetical protein [uncultured Tenacibaculum sp.]|uniref:hypothetical protein n=1 Tax=uncultured Tenacibaculum sp. TaxID=174713 RepID=UPI002621C983|nr:hypothetical protein [uncultured Tenacibaculum sp.]